MDYIFYVLHGEELAKYPKNNPDQRLKVIINELFKYVYEKIS
jgi:hypothetical protein